MDEATVSRARGLWEELAGGRFPERGEVRVIQTTTSRLCPPGWAGIIMLAGAMLATAPTAEQAALLTAALPDTGSLPVVDSLGPAELAYLSPSDFQSYGDERPGDPDRPAPGVEWAGPDALAELLATADPAEAKESGLSGLPRAAVVRSGGRIVAAAGYERWPVETAHLCVLTHPDQRGRGHATRAGAVATADALAAGLLPQWRAGVRPSLRVADKLGYRALGRQRSLRLE